MLGCQLVLTPTHISPLLGASMVLVHLLLQWKTKHKCDFVQRVCSMETIHLYLTSLEVFLEKPCLQSYWMNTKRVFWKWGDATKQRWPTRWKLSSRQQGNRHLSDHPPLIDLSRALTSSHLFPTPIYPLVLASCLCLLPIINLFIRTLIYISVT